jgi:hypothetical protein
MSTLSRLRLAIMYAGVTGADARTATIAVDVEAGCRSAASGEALSRSPRGSGGQALKELRDAVVRGEACDQPIRNEEAPVTEPFVV